MFHMMKTLNPEIECLALLSRHYSQLEDIPHSIQEDLESLMEKRKIPSSVLMPDVEPLIQIETHVLNGMTTADSRMPHLFLSSEGLFANLAWSLYFIEQEKVDFTQLTPEDRERELHHALAMTLNCPMGDLESIHDLESLIAFLERHPASNTTKWIFTLFWTQPEEYQALFRRTLEQATALFCEVSHLADPLLERHMADLQTLIDSDEDGSIIKSVASASQQDILVYPFIMRCQGFGMIRDHTSTKPKSSFLLTGILYQHIKDLSRQFSDNSSIISNGAKALADARRVDILKALTKEPMCNLELSALLNLSAATIAHHMTQLLREGFVTTNRQGNRVDYHINPGKVRMLADSILGILPRNLL